MVRTIADVLIVGAGIIGCALARELAASRRRVVVVERHQPGAGASGAAAGILSPQAEADGPSPMLELCLESRAMFPRLVEELLSETGIEVPYRTSGTLFLALDGAGEARLERRFAWQAGAGLHVERLSRGRVLTLEPAIKGSVRIALRFPYDHQIDNLCLTRALALSADRFGARFQSGGEVTRVLTQGGRVQGVAVGSSKIYSPRVVLCGGAWSGSIDIGGPRIPVTPVRGQMLALETGEVRVDRVIYSEHGYLVPRLDGRILVGSTTEHAGFDARPTAKGIGLLLDVAQRIVPALEHASIAGVWAGLRPGSPDGLPILGPAGAAWPDGLFFATGHFRNGILLAPITARLLTEALITGKTSFPLDPFLASRFHR